MPAPYRNGELLRLGREVIAYGRNVVAHTGSKIALQHRLFVNDPWELIAEAIVRSVPQGRTREVAQSFRRQAEDYFRVATTARELPVRPVLLYYAFLNLSKAYAIAKGNTSLSQRAYHGVSCSPTRGTILGTPIAFDKRHNPAVFRELLQHLNGNLSILNFPMTLRYLLPQVLPGHRLWCYATNKSERFLTIQNYKLLHAARGKQVWLNLYVRTSELDQANISERTVLSGTDLEDFEITVDPEAPSLICIQQRNPSSYTTQPTEALEVITKATQNKFWETVRLESPYRKPYLYCCPNREHAARLPQVLSVYLLMFFLGSVTRYSPGYFEDLLDSKYGPLFATFISESPMQYLYLMASEILGREVSKPAII